jgi:hypothetical protein
VTAQFIGKKGIHRKVRWVRLIYLIQRLKASLR